MKKQLLFYLMLAMLLTSCGSIYVDHDYEKNIDFTAFKSYQYDIPEGSGLSEFDERRFIRYTDSILQAQGYVLSETPDLWMEIRANEYEAQSRNTLGVGIGGGGNVGVGVSGGIPIGGSEMHQVIEVTIIQASNNATIWEATSDSDIKLKAKPAQRDAHFQKLVTKIFRKFPPEQKQ